MIVLTLKVSYALVLAGALIVVMRLAVEEVCDRAIPLVCRLAWALVYLGIVLLIAAFVMAVFT